MAPLSFDAVLLQRRSTSTSFFFDAVLLRRRPSLALSSWRHRRSALMMTATKTITAPISRRTRHTVRRMRRHSLSKLKKEFGDCDGANHHHPFATLQSVIGCAPTLSPRPRSQRRHRPMFVASVAGRMRGNKLSAAANVSATSTPSDALASRTIARPYAPTSSARNASRHPRLFPSLPPHQ